tara:strand:+ start:1118 stop:2080 length:963 start_codon:yes stop_codon:yes gene_type:complete
MSSPDRNFIFNEEILPQTPDGISLPAPRGPVVPGGPATPGSPVAAAAAAAPSYPLDGPEQPSPSREELEGFYSSVEGSSISRNLFPDDDDDEEAAAAAAEVEMLIKRFSKPTVDRYIKHYAAGWIDAIKRTHGYDSSKYGLVPIIVAPAPAGASGEKRKKPTKKKGKKRHRKRGGGKKKNKKKRTKKKSRRITKKRRKKKTRKKRGGLTTPADKNNLEPGKIYFYKRPGSNWIFKGTYSGPVNGNLQFDNWSGSEKQGTNFGRLGPFPSFTEDISHIDKIWRFNPRGVQEAHVLPDFLSERISGFVGGKRRRKKNRKTRR